LEGEGKGAAQHLECAHGVPPTLRATADEVIE
jgi:hypothetical protein